MRWTGQPWSPDLLEWLAAQFVASGYDLKWLLKTIMTSKTYQLASVDEVDQADAYVYRGPRPRRLTAEQFADSVSAITGEWPVLSGDAPGQALYFARVAAEVQPPYPSAWATDSGSGLHDPETRRQPRCKPSSLSTGGP